MAGIGRKIRTVTGAGMLVMLAAGCTSIRDHRGYLVDAALVSSVQPGVDNRDSVERALGRPTFISQFGDPAWYYVSVNTTQAAFTRPKTNSQWVMRVRFDAAGNVLAVEQAGMDRVVRLDPDGNKTPTLGKERGFLEDLFGNIGTVGAPMGQGGGGNTGGGPNGS